MKRREGAGSRNTAAVAVVAAAHGLILTLLIVEATQREPPTARQPPDIAVELLRPDRSATARKPRNQVSAPIATLRPRSSPRTVTAPAPVQTLPVPVATATPSPPASPAAGASAGEGPAQGDTSRAQAALRAALACGHGGFLRLSDAERATCDRRLADARGEDLPKVDVMPNVKRAYYDSVLQHREEQRYGAFNALKDKQLARGLAGVKSHGIDVNVGYHCTFKFGPGAKETNAAAGKKIGFPPCPIRLPGVDPAPP